MRDLFALLLRAFRIAAGRSSSPPAPRELPIRILLEGFREVRERTDATAHCQAVGDREALRSLLVRYGRATENHRRQQQEHADEFNLLAVMQLTEKEIRHSMVLAWLLDHDMGKLGTHAQGALGFRLFLKELGLPVHYSDCKYWVHREEPGEDAIVDIEVACRGQFLIHIEIKIWASEGTDQTNREWADLRRRSTELGLNFEAADARIHALFLTPRGTRALNTHFRSISWRRIIAVLEAFSVEAKPPDVKMFAAHYARGIRRFIVTRNLKEDEDDEGTDERSRAVSPATLGGVSPP